MGRLTQEDVRSALPATGPLLTLGVFSCPSYSEYAGHILS